ncbi:MlaD family protein [Pseudonocardia halophobica]|uniref:MlaD family protein n=1 Tax=Pseudonocardia halophobica TaxID=29401 RepID=UPI003D936718
MNGPTIRTSGRRRGRLAAVALALVALSGTAAASAPDDSVARYTAIFTDASPLLVGNDVRLAGIKVGEIADMQVADGHARLTLDLDRSVLPLHTDTRLTVRPVSLLGERFIDLDRGTAAAPVMAEGTEVPVTQTGRSTDLDEVLDAVDDPTGQALAAMVGTLGDGLEGQGADVDAAIKALRPAMTNTAELADVLNEQNDTLNSLVDSLEPVASSLAADQGRSLDRLVDSAHGLLGTAAQREQGLRDSIQEMPGTFASARSTLAELTGAAHEATPTLQSLRPTTDNLAEVSRELIAFADSADPALASLEPVLHHGRELLDAARPVAADLRAQGPDTVKLANGAEPLVRDLTDNRINVMEFLKRWALTTNSKDGLSHYFRAYLSVTPQSVTASIPGEGGNAGIGGVVPPITTEPGGQPVQTNNGNPDGLLTPPSADPAPDAGVTGLTREQEGGALGFLIGGDK